MLLLKRQLTKAFGRFALAASALSVSFGLAAGSASAAPIPFLYLVPSGPATVPTVVPVGTSTYQLWLDPSGVTTPGCTIPIAGQCNGIIGFDATNPVTGSGPGVLAYGSLTMTAFTSIQYGGSHLFGPLQFCSYGFLICGPPPPCVTCTSGLYFFTGDPQNGNATPFEVGTMTLVNNGTGSGAVTLWFGEYLDTNGNYQNTTSFQILAAAAPVPEPSTLLLVATAVLGLAVRRHNARGASLG